MKKIVFLTLIIGIYVMAEESNMVFKPLPAESLSHLEEQRQYVKNLTAKHFKNKEFLHSEDDFFLLQAIVDANLISSEKTWELQSLGVVFGDTLIAEIDGLAWWQVTDDYGTDAVLRYNETTLQIGAKTMISKRVEDGKEVDIMNMYIWLKDFIESKSHEYQ